ncbi:MAG: FxLYD domain-containing protein [Leptolyngbyaceae cyanobacterium bins.59]|nr:FxLYD domain-containing protein [Leptolyngbyaceae cyanobacterium bins.59]
MTQEKYEQIIQTYIERVTALRNQPLGLPDANTLETIAQELGMTEADLQRAEEVAKAGKLRGLGYAHHRRWNDAITELSQAVALKPTDVDMMYHLADAYKERWLVTQESRDRQEAMQLAKRCLELNPSHEPSFALLNTLDQPPLPVLRRYHPGTMKWFFGLVGFSILFLMVAGFVSMVFIRQSPQITEPTTVSPVEDSETPQPGEVAVPARLEAGDETGKISLQVRDSHYTTFGSNFYTLSADVKNTGKTEIHALKLKIELLDQQGNVLQTDFHDTVSDGDAPLRPGDEIGFERLIEKAARTQSVRVSIQTIKEKPAAQTYSPSQGLPIQWLSQRPSEVNIEVRERNSQFDNYSSGSAYHTVILEVKNTGQVAVKELKLQIQTLDADDRILSSEEYFWVSSSEPSLLPGKSRVKRFINSTTSGFRRYQVAIVNVD